MTRFSFKLFDAAWQLCMGLYLGLGAGLVLAVILTFRAAKVLQAAPGVEPWNHPRFSPYYADAVAGYIGQDLFMVGGVGVLVLLGLAVVARLLHGLVVMRIKPAMQGSRLLSRARTMLLSICVLLMLWSANHTVGMNRSWPGLYDLGATDTQLVERRARFEASHKTSERLAGAAWLSGLAALVISPWCRRPVAAD